MSSMVFELDQFPAEVGDHVAWAAVMQARELFLEGFEIDTMTFSLEDVNNTHRVTIEIVGDRDDETRTVSQEVIIRREPQ